MYIYINPLCLLLTNCMYSVMFLKFKTPCPNTFWNFLASNYWFIYQGCWHFSFIKYNTVIIFFFFWEFQDVFWLYFHGNSSLQSPLQPSYLLPITFSSYRACPLTRHLGFISDVSYNERLFTRRWKKIKRLKNTL